MKMKSIQTGLRLPENLYNEFRDIQQQTGISINQQVLFLVDVGRRVIHRGIQAEGHYPVHSEVCTDVQRVPPNC